MKKRSRKKNNLPIWVAALCLGIVGFSLGFSLGVRDKRAQAQPQPQEPAPVATPAATPEPEATVAPEPTLSPEEQQYQQALARAQANATNAQPELVHPARWQENAWQVLDAIAAIPDQQASGFTNEEREGYPYLLAVNRAASTVTVYALDESGRYTRPYMAMVCSGGSDTPTGFFHTPVDYPWRLLAGPSYGQYATRIWDCYLFHSVPYYSQHKDDVEYDEFNKLGTLASLGCIRLAVVDVKWIYDNCPIGTPVVIYDDAETPGPMGKPGTIYTDPADEALRGWDPTDPDPANPWPEQFRSGTAIRSEAAQEEWNAAQADGRWSHNLTPTDLQGWSHDSAIEGTRG